MSRVLGYNIHDILKFQIINNGKAGFRDLHKLRFACFETEVVSSPDIVMNIGKFTPSNENCYLVDYKYHVKDNYFYCHETKGKARWEVEIKGLERGDTVINFHLSNRFQINPINMVRLPMVLPQLFLLRLIEHKLGNKGYFLTHSAAVSKDNKAFLLSGRGGCFKTSLCMDFVRQAGYDWLGDDRVILNKNKVLGFPMNSAIFRYMVKHVADETRVRFFNQVQFATEYLSGKHKAFDENEAKSAVLSALFLVARSQRLRSGKQVNFELLPQTSGEHIVESLLLSNRIEDFLAFMPSFGIDSAPFLRYMLAYSFVFPANAATTQQKDMAENLKSTLKGIPIYRVEIPPDYSVDTFNQIHRFIMENC